MPDNQDVTKFARNSAALLWLGIMVGFGLVVGVRFATWLLGIF